MRIPTITQETIPGPYAISENTNRLNILATLTKQDPIYIYMIHFIYVDLALNGVPQQFLTIQSMKGG